MCSQGFQDHLAVVQKKRGRWKLYRGKVDVKRRRAYRQEATERRLLYENRTAEYAAGIGLDIGAENATTNATRNRRRRTHCRCGSATHLTTRSRHCRLNRINIQNNIILCGETNEEKEEEVEIANDTIGEIANDTIGTSSDVITDI